MAKKKPKRRWVESIEYVANEIERLERIERAARACFKFYPDVDADVEVVYDNVPELQDALSAPGKGDG